MEGSEIYIVGDGDKKIRWTTRVDSQFLVYFYQSDGWCLICVMGDSGEVLGTYTYESGG